MHQFPLTVYYEESDGLGIVYHANYLRYFCRARTEWLALSGQTLSQHAARGYCFTVRKADLNYLQPARVGDQLRVATQVLRVGGASIQLQQDLYRPVDDQTLCRAVIQLACVSPQLKPVKLPNDLRQWMQQ